MIVIGYVIIKRNIESLKKNGHFAGVCFTISVTAYPCQSRSGCEAYPGNTGYEVEIQPGWDNSPAQGTMYTDLVSFCSSFNLPSAVYFCNPLALFWDNGKKPPQKVTQAQD